MELINGCYRISFHKFFSRRYFRIIVQIVRIDCQIHSIVRKSCKTLSKIVRFKKKKSSNLLRPGIPVLRSVRQFFLFFFQENCTQEKGRKEMTGGCTIDECAWVNEFLLFLSDGIYSFNVKTNSWWWDKLCAYLACSKNILLSGIPSKMQTANDPISLDVTFQELQLRYRQREFVSFPRAYLMF